MGLNCLCCSHEERPVMIWGHITWCMVKDGHLAEGLILVGSQQPQSGLSQIWEEGPCPASGVERRSSSTSPLHPLAEPTSPQEQDSPCPQSAWFLTCEGEFTSLVSPVESSSSSSLVTSQPQLWMLHQRKFPSSSHLAWLGTCEQPQEHLFPLMEVPETRPVPPSKRAACR